MGWLRGNSSEVKHIRINFNYVSHLQWMYRGIFVKAFSKNADGQDLMT